MAALRAAFMGVFQDLVVSARSTPFTRRAILPHLPKMASVLGRRQPPCPVQSALPLIWRMCVAGAHQARVCTSRESLTEGNIEHAGSCINPGIQSQGMCIWRIILS